VTSKPLIAVCGDGDPETPHRALAEEVGRLLAEAGAVVITGGLQGVTESAARGAAEAGGTVVGVLPGSDRREANRYVTLPIATGLGQARNAVLVTAADAVIAIGSRGWGTLSEIAFARRLGRRVIGLETWAVEGLETAASAEEAVRAVLA
jgi:uncharacterized protein (TIGR00725 family)